MKTILTQTELMREYTNLVAEQIGNGNVMKLNRGFSSMYESETHFEPENKEYESLLVALERSDAKEELGFRYVWDVDVFELVVKNIRNTFDDGDVLSSKTIIRFSTRKRDAKGDMIYYYVTDVDVARGIVEKRDVRSTQKWGIEKTTVEFTPTTEFTEKLRSRKGFTNAKASKIKVARREDGYYTITNTALKTKPALTVGF